MKTSHGWFPTKNLFQLIFLFCLTLVSRASTETYECYFSGFYDSDWSFPGVLFIYFGTLERSSLCVFFMDMFKHFSDR